MTVPSRPGAATVIAVPIASDGKTGVISAPTNPTYSKWPPGAGSTSARRVRNDCGMGFGRVLVRYGSVIRQTSDRLYHRGSDRTFAGGRRPMHDADGVWIEGVAPVHRAAVVPH